MLKSMHPKKLAATIRLIHGGGTMISQDVAHISNDKFFYMTSLPLQLGTSRESILKKLQGRGDEMLKKEPAIILITGIMASGKSTRITSYNVCYTKLLRLLQG